jgi:hypothetical protein
MGCIDERGNITRSAELILLACMKPAPLDRVAGETGFPLFRVRGAVRELTRAGLLIQVGDDFNTTPEGIRRIEQGAGS